MVLNVTIPQDTQVNERRFKDAQGNDVLFFEARLIEVNTIYVCRSANKFEQGICYSCSVKKVENAGGFKVVHLSIKGDK